MDASLAPGSLVGWLRLGFGLGILLLPGVAAADRVFRPAVGPAPRRPRRSDPPFPLELLTAPVFSLSLLPLAAIALDFTVGVPIHPVTTFALALALAAWLGWPRIAQAWRWMSRPADPSSMPGSAHEHQAGRRGSGRSDGGGSGRWDGRGSARWSASGGARWDRSGSARQDGQGSGRWGRRGSWARGPALGLLVILPLLMLVHGLQHVPGDAAADEPGSPLDAYPSLVRHAVDAVQGDQYPYPIHVDEHIHIAYMAQIEREGTAGIVDPYTTLPEASQLFSVQGMRSERGWQVAMVQVHDLTGLSFSALARWVPAVWSAFLGLTLYLALRPAPGAVAAAALVAVLPTDVRFLGIGYLVPSAFALPWILVTLLVAQRTSGGSRFFALVLLLTAAHFLHLVIGVLCILAAVAGTLTRDDARGRRTSMLVAALLPLVWILPTTYQDARQAVQSEHTLPFNVEFLAVPGLAIYALAVAGTLLAWLTPRTTNQPHRAMSLMAIPMALSLLLSIRLDHANDATYSRQVFAFMLVLVGLASYGLGEGLRRAARIVSVGGRVPLLRDAVVRHAGVAAVVVVLLAAPLAAHMQYEPYRVHNEATWQAVQALAASDVGPGDIFLSHPWEAPLYNSVTGAVPHTVLRPGTPPERGGDWEAYLRSGGADAAWLQARGITVVVADVPPDAPHRVLGPHVYRVL